MKKAAILFNEPDEFSSTAWLEAQFFLEMRYPSKYGGANLSNFWSKTRYVTVEIAKNVLGVATRDSEYGKQMKTAEDAKAFLAKKGKT